VALSGKTFRIFISSTFSDLKEERNALQERVFPRLRDLCMAHGFRFQAIDLRWGVSEEASLDQQTVRICLEEIARCQKTALKPNFIVLLGDRYGWCPLPYEIPASEFEEIERRVNDSSTHELLATWYRRDDNAVPPVYCLQRRTGEFVDLSVWEERVERPLRAALLEAVAGMDLPEDDRLKYDSSATEQEIVRGAMKVEDAREHIFCFFRSFLVERADGSVAAQRENGHLSPVDEVSRDGDFHQFVDRAPHGEFDPGAYAQLANLKGRLESLLPGKTMKYQARWTDSGVTLSHLDALCTDVYDSLSREILKQISRFEKTDSQEQENQAHEEFGEDRARFFVGRAAILDTIRKHINSGKRHPLAIIGAPGSGKSALMARAVHEAREDHSEAEVIPRFIGATPPSSDGRTLLEDLCRRIGRAYGSEEETPLEYRDLVREFPKRLALATNQKPLILFLDALDQLSAADRARSLTWLPSELPENVSLVVSATPGECMDAMKRRLSPDSLEELEPMAACEGVDLLDRWLIPARRALRPDQKSEVLGKFAKCGMPLYLKLAFEEVRCWKSYDDLPLGTDGKRGLSEEVPGLIEDFLRRLSREEEHGETLVSRSLEYIAAGKNGLAEDELLEVLSDDGEVVEDFQRRSPKSPPVAMLPVVVWSRLRADLAPYLIERQADGTTLISFFHRQFGEAVVRKCLDDGAKRTRHESLARYFTSRPLWLETDGKKIPNLRKLSESPFQQAHGGMASKLRDTLIDFDFMYAKVFAVGPQPLIADYDLAYLCALPGNRPIIEKAVGLSLRLVQGTLRLSSHILAHDSSQLSAQLLARLLSCQEPDVQALLRQAKKGPDVPWLRPLTQSLAKAGESLLCTLTGHENPVFTVAIASNGRIAVSFNILTTLRVWELDSGSCRLKIRGCNPYPLRLVISADGQHVAYPCQNSFELCDTRSGERIRAPELHSGRVTAVALSPDGERVFSASVDGNIMAWNRRRTICLETMRSVDGNGIVDMAMTSSGKHLVSLSSDGTINRWDAGSLDCLRTFECVAKGAIQIAATPDARYAISAEMAKGLKLWDLETGHCLRTLEQVQPTSFGTLAVAGSPDAKLIAVTASKGDENSWNKRRDVEVWDLINGDRLCKFESHDMDVLAVAVTPDMRYVVSASADKTLKAWDLGSALTQYSGIPGHRGTAAIAMTPDGSKAVSAHADGLLTVWDMKSGKPGRKMVSKGEKNAVAVTANGRRCACPGYDGDLEVWDLDKGSRLVLLEGWCDHVLSLSFFCGDRQVVTVGRNYVGRWYARSGKRIGIRLQNHGRTNSVALAPMANRILFGRMDILPDEMFGSIGVIDVCDLRNGTMMHSLEPHGDAIWAVSVNGNGFLAVSGANDGTLKVWNLMTRKEMFLLRGHAGGINSIAVTPRGHRAVSGSHDRNIMLWDLEKRCAIAAFTGDTAIVDCEISADGMTVAATEDSGAVHLLKLENMDTSLLQKVLTHG